jgi:hypothetical protein
VERIKIATSYESKWIETDRPQPLCDNFLESLIQDVLTGNTNRDISEQVYVDFKRECQRWLIGSCLNNLQGLDTFTRIDIINGCTQFIDNLYMKGSIQTIKNDYRYHNRLNLSSIQEVGNLIPDIPLIIALPFPQVGTIHNDMDEILNECQRKNIPIHIDGAWISCCRSVDFNFDHPSVVSVGISLSKGLGLGWNRIGLRWTKDENNDSISIMNDFRMNNKALTLIALHFLKRTPVDYLWNTHSDRYYKVCRDFDLTPTNSIHLALRNGNPVGVSPLIRYLENND